MNKKTLSIILAVLVLTISLMVGVFGCGKTNDYQAPDGSTITVSGNTTWNNLSIDTVNNYQVVVKYSDGTPVPNAKLYISGALAVQNTSQFAAYQFYFNADADNVNPNYPVTSGAFNATTDDFGVYEFSIKWFGATTLGFLPIWKDNVYITSGTANAILSLSTTTS